MSLKKTTYRITSFVFILLHLSCNKSVDNRINTITGSFSTTSSFQGFTASMNAYTSSINEATASNASTYPKVLTATVDTITT